MHPNKQLQVGLFLTLLALPPLLSLLGHCWPVLREEPLAGVEAAVPLRPLRWDTWWSGEFQQTFETWFARNVGRQPFLVRLENQINLSVFGWVRPGGTGIVVGREGWLYEPLYVGDYHRSERLDPGEATAAVDLQRRLGELLRRRGVALVTVIAPTKPEIYPERLPGAAPLPSDGERLSKYGQFAPLLAGTGLAVVDAHRLFVDRRARDSTLLFAPGGTHWNHYGTALVAGAILETIARLQPGTFPAVEVAGVRVDGTLWGADCDLGALLNTWDWRSYCGPQTHPVLWRTVPGRRLPRLLFVGDSFSLPLIDFMTEERLIEPGDDLYYFKRRVSYPGEVSTPLDPEAFDLLRELEGLDAVVVVTNEHFLPQLGFGFPERAVPVLEDAERLEGTRGRR